MDIEKILTLPDSPHLRTSFYEKTEPVCIVSSPLNAKKTTVPYGNYNNLEWSSTFIPSVLTNQTTTWGTKTFPGAGPYYFANHEDGMAEFGKLPDE